MIRRIDDARPAFVLDTERTTYAFRILPTGQPEHLYYGRRLPLETIDDLAALTEQHAFAPGNTVVYEREHPEYSLEDVCLEVSSSGKGDLREPFLTLVHADGGRTSDFVFESAEITDGQPASGTLPGAYSEDGRVEHLTLRLRDGHYGLTLELWYEVWPDCDCITRSARLINDGNDPVRIERLMSLQLDLPERGWAVSSFHGAWTREMERSTLTLNGGKFVIDSRAGCSSSRANPFFLLHAPDCTEEAGDCFGFNLVYSGDHYAAVEVGGWGKTRVVTGIQPDGFSWLLEPKDLFEAPEAVMTYSPDGFGGQSRSMHRFVREHIVRGAWKHKARPVLLNSWEASYFKISESSLVSLAKAGKDVGIELFVMDDGWFGERDDDSHSLGDWDVNKKKLPGGLGGLARRINELGLDFGLWVEPEMVNIRSRLYGRHPEWVMAIPGKAHAEGRNQRLLDLGNPAVQDFIIEKLSEVFSSAPVTYVKWDFNRVFSDVYSQCLPPERQGEAAHRYVLGLYRVMKALTGRFPEILFEGCAAGGNRFDLGILSYFPQIWASDDTDAIARTHIQEGYSYGYPQSVVAAHVSGCPNHQTLRSTPLDTRFGVAAFGLLGYELDLRDLGPEQKRELREQIALYKQWRDVLQFGDFYRGRGGSGNVHEWTAVSPDGKRAAGLLLQELVQPNVQFERYFARGLRPDRKYRFHSAAKKLNVKLFGSLVNTAAPFHVKQDSLAHNVIAKVMTMPGEQEDLTASGETLMRAGVKLKQAYSGTGYNENVRYFQDFSSRLYYMEAVED